MAKINYREAKFLYSAAKLNQLPKNEGIEVAFAGRSNAGKSTALNCLTDQRGLARASKTPGRTQLINLFELTEECRLVDLPGYGYAKVSLEVKKRWQATLAQYLQQRECLAGLVLLSDIRHPLKELDLNMLDWAVEEGLEVHLLLSKADKLKSGVQKSTLLKVKKELKLRYPTTDLVSVQIFSSLKKVGLDILRTRLDNWFRSKEDKLEE